MLEFDDSHHISLIFPITEVSQFGGVKSYAETSPLFIQEPQLFIENRTVLGDGQLVSLPREHVMDQL